MGRFSWMSIAVMFAGCGDNLGAGADPQPNLPGITGTDVPSTTPSRVFPEACGKVNWTTGIATDKAVDVAVVAGAQQGTLIAVPSGGGRLSGFSFDLGMDASSNGIKVPLAGTFDRVATTMLGDHVVAAVRGTAGVQLALLDDSLSSVKVIDKLPTDLVASGVMYRLAGQQPVIPYATADGLYLQPLDAGLQPKALQHYLTTDPVIGLTATQDEGNILVAMSTATDCHIQLVESISSGYGSTLPVACESPMVAAAPQQGSAGLVFEYADAVWFALIEQGQIVSGHRMSASATSPRIVFDGQRYWASFLDAEGHVEVGFIDAQNQLNVIKLSDTRPQSDAYQLVMINGSVWVIGLDPPGYTAHRVCAASAG